MDDILAGLVEEVDEASTYSGSDVVSILWRVIELVVQAGHRELQAHSATLRVGGSKISIRNSQIRACSGQLCAPFSVVRFFSLRRRHLRKLLLSALCNTFTAALTSESSFESSDRSNHWLFLELWSRHLPAR